MNKIKLLLKKVPIVFHLLKIIQDRRYFYHYLQGFLSNKKARSFFTSLESKFFFKKNDLIKDNFVDVKDNINKLKTSGVIENPIFIAKNKIDKIVDFLKSKQMHDPELYSNDYFYYDNRPVQVKRGFYKCEDVVYAPHVLEIANDPMLLSIAYEYFGAIPCIDYIGSWWSFPSNDLALTQSFHRDIDTLNSLKFFVYLTDVDKESGPHVYVKGSHNSSYRTSKDKMHNDFEIENEFNKSNIVNLEGEEGYTFIADTFGFHKGLPPTNKSRLVLQIIYTLKRTPFGPKSPFICMEDAVKLTSNPFSNYVNRNIIKA